MADQQVPSYADFLGGVDDKNKTVAPPSYADFLSSGTKAKHRASNPNDILPKPFLGAVGETIGKTGSDVLKSFDPRNILNTITGGIEGAANVGSGIAGFLGGTAAGLGSQVVEAVKGNPNASTTASETASKVANALTYKPTSEMGQSAAGVLNKPFELLGKAKEAIQDKLGFDPEQKAATSLALDMSMALGVAHPPAWLKDLASVSEGKARKFIVDTLPKVKNEEITAAGGAKKVIEEAQTIAIAPPVSPAPPEAPKPTNPVADALGGIRDEIAPSVGIKPSDISAPRENGGYTAVVLKDGTALVGGKNHGETVNLAMSRGYKEADVINGTPAFSRPDGKTWDIKGNPVETSGRVDLTIAPPNPTTPNPTKPTNILADALMPEAPVVPTPIEPSPTEPINPQAGFVKTPEWAQKIAAALSPDKLYEDLVTKDWGVDKLPKQAEKATGVALSETKNPALLKRLYLGVRGKVDQTLENGPYKYNEQAQKFDVLGEGLKPILRDYSSGVSKLGVKDLNIQKTDLNDFLRDTRIVEDFQRNVGQGAKAADMATIRQSQANLNRLNQKYGNNIGVLKSTADRIWQYNDNLLKLGVGTIISPEEYANIRRLNPHYVPLDQILKDVEGNERVNSTGGTFTDQSKIANPLKPLKGGTGEAHDVFGNMARYTSQWVKLVDDNTIKTTIADLADVLPDRVQKVGPKMMPVKLEDGTTVFRPSSTPPTPTSFSYRVNGETHWVDVAPDIYRAMTSQTPGGAVLGMRLLKSVGNMLRIGATSTPEFWTRNLWRDNLDANIQTKTRYTPFVNIPKAIGDILKKTELYQEYQRSAAAGGGLVNLERKQLNKTYENLVKNPSLISKLNIVRDAESISELFEQATRFAVYKSQRGKGKSPLASAFASREATTDFGRIGAKTKGVNDVIKFFNAGIQGDDRFIRAIKDDPKGTITKAIISITVPSIAEYFMYRNDEDYKNLATWDKNLFWHFKTPIGFVRVPRPFLPGQVFGTLPQHFIEWVDKKDPKALNGMMGTMFDAMSPTSGDPAGGIVPTALKPLIEVSIGDGGWDFFRGKPIVPRGKQGLPTNLQATPYTSNTATALSNALQMVGIKLGPAKTEHIVTGLTGGMGKYALDASDAIGGAIGKVSKGEKVGSIMADEPSHAVLLRGWMSRPPYEIESQDLQDFYSNMKKAESWRTAVNQSGKSGNGPSAAKMAKEHPEIALTGYLDGVALRMRDIRGEIDATKNSRAISDSARKNKMMMLARQLNSLARDANAKYEGMVK